MAYLLHQLIEEAAAADPDHVALSCRGADITYAELFERAGRLANVLTMRGVKPGDRVGIYLNKCLETGIALYGIMMAGAAYVPLDPTAPIARLAFIVNDCHIEHLISEPAKRERLEAMAREAPSLRAVIGLDEDIGDVEAIDWRAVAGASQETSPRVTEMDPCYILYTSGSTGVPKGIAHTHRSAISWANVTASTYRFGPEDVLSNYAPLQFDLSTLDFFGGARSGATTVMIPEEYLKLPTSLAGFLEESGITVFFTVPMALVQLSQPGVLDGKGLGKLRLVLFGGEPMPLKHLASIMERVPQAEFVNVYGPTEVNGVTHFPVESVPDPNGPPLPIGEPYANVEALVVDSSGNPVDDGEMGELLIRAPTMMRGYWARNDLNEEVFYFRQRFSGLPEVFLRTGDLAHRDREGVFHFHGRKDRQVKSRGFRVELDEVEAALLSHPAVEEAATYVITEGDGTVLIRAAATLAGHEVKEAALRRHMATSLPGYALPTSIEIVDDFPRTTTGKIDRKTLAERAGALIREGSRA